MTQMLNRVLVLGGRGRFGLAVTRAFAEAGWEVLAQVRPGAAGPVIPGVQWLAIDAHDSAALATAAQGAQVVVQGLSPVYTHRAWQRDLPGLTQAAINVSRQLQATLMLPASVYNFGQTMPAQLHEDTVQTPSTFKGRMRVASESQVRAATENGGMQAVVIRAGDFFGSGAGSWFDEVMVKDIRRGKFTYPGPMDVPTAWAYLPDLARCFTAVAAQRSKLAAYETFHFSGYSVTGQQWVDAMHLIAKERGWLGTCNHLQISSLSWLMMRALGLFMPKIAALNEMRYQWRTPHALVNTRMADLCGPEPHTPFPVALRQALDDLGLAGGSVVESNDAHGMAPST